MVVYCSFVTDVQRTKGELYGMIKLFAKRAVDFFSELNT